MPIPQLDKQIKEAERDKLVAEKDKLEYELSVLKKSRKREFWPKFLAASIVFTAIGFYLEYGLKPTLQRDALQNQITNLHLERHLDSLADSLNKVKKSLTKQEKTVTKSLKAYDSLRTVLNKKADSFSVFTQSFKSFKNLTQKQLSDSSKKLKKYADGINDYQYEFTKIYSQLVLSSYYANKGIISIDMVFELNGQYLYFTDYYIVTEFNGKPLFIFPDVPSKSAPYLALPAGKYEVRIIDKGYKLSTGKFQFSISQDEVDSFSGTSKRLTVGLIKI